MTLVRMIAAAALALTCGAASAETYPSRPVRIVLPYATGGGVDAAARLVAQHLTTALGQSFVVVSRPGGSTIIGTDFVARSAPDGYTLLLAGGSTMSLLPLTYGGKLPFDPLADFEPIGLVSRLPFFLVTAGDQPYRSVKDLMQAARAHDGTMTFASNGIGLIGHIGTEMLLQNAGVHMVHVPYTGFAPALGDLITGRVSMVMADLAPIAGQLQAGTLRALAVASPQRSRILPDVQTLAEAGYANSAFEVWLGLFAPAKTPKDIVAKLTDELSRYLATPEARDAFARIGQEADGTRGDALRLRIAAEQKAFAPAVRAANLASDGHGHD